MLVLNSVQQTFNYKLKPLINFEKHSANGQNNTQRGHPPALSTPMNSLVLQQLTSLMTSDAQPMQPIQQQQCQSGLPQEQSPMQPMQQTQATQAMQPMQPMQHMQQMQQMPHMQQMQPMQPMQQTGAQLVSHSVPSMQQPQQNTQHLIPVPPQVSQHKQLACQPQPPQSTKAQQEQQNQPNQQSQLQQQSQQQQQQEQQSQQQEQSSMQQQQEEQSQQQESQPSAQEHSQPPTNDTTQIRDAITTTDIITSEPQSHSTFNNSNNDNDNEFIDQDDHDVVTTTKCSQHENEIEMTILNSRKNVVTMSKNKGLQHTGKKRTRDERMLMNNENLSSKEKFKRISSSHRANELVKKRKPDGNSMCLPNDFFFSNDKSVFFVHCF